MPRLPQSLAVVGCSSVIDADHSERKCATRWELHVSWWYNLINGQVEEGPGAPNAERLGPFETEAEAKDALENARRRNEDWDAKDKEWDGDNE